MNQPKEKPILFSAPMVMAILEGRKSQTRRIVKDVTKLKVELPSRVRSDIPIPPRMAAKAGVHAAHVNRLGAVSVATEFGLLGVKPGEFNWLSPYGKPGDRLWVRESFYQFGHWEAVPGVKTKTGRMKWKFVADSPSSLFRLHELGDFPVRKGRHHKDPETRAWHKRLGRFMPRKASRITLEITDVRVQRLQEIGLAEARAEGCEVREFSLFGSDQDGRDNIGRIHFGLLWESINGRESWEANPWVWAITFKRIETAERAA
jgi:hypothetical protein